ncbi:MAG: hypothetical protein J2P48_17615 [Alphaproteobacteria bacterium]|nr:hypothetical protein [Alphaproteobacteria bacterium]
MIEFQHLGPRNIVALRDGEIIARLNYSKKTGWMVHAYGLDIGGRNDRVGPGVRSFPSLDEAGQAVINAAEGKEVK